MPAPLVPNGVGGLWAGANARALRDRKRWAHASTTAYWVCVGLSCCGVPLSAYGYGA